MPDEHRNTRNWGRIVAAAGIGLAKSAMLSALVLGPGMLIMEEHLFLGWLWLLVGSFAMMAWSYRKEWRMTRIAILAPPLAAIGAFLVQLVIFGQEPSLLWGAIALAAGLAVGFARGETHRVFARDNAVFAQRTIGFLGVWLLCYLITQYFSMMGQRDYLPIAHASGAFSAAMLTMVAIMLWGKFSGRKRELVMAAPANAPPAQKRTAGRKGPDSKKKAPRKGKGPGAAPVIIFLLLATGIGGYHAMSLAAPVRTAMQQPPEGIYYDTPVPESRMYAGDPALIPMIEYRQGCSVGLGLYTPNISTPGGRPTKYTHFTSIRNYCSAHPDAYLCSDCRAPGLGSGPISVPEGGAEAGAAAAIAASILILAGGTAVNIATAVADAASRAAEAASRGEGTPAERRERGAGKRGAPSRRPRAPSKPPDIINPYEQAPFETDGKGNYWAPDNKGEWVWMDANGAREAAAAMGREIGQRSRERADFERDSRQAIAEAQAKARERDDAERAHIAEEEAEAAARAEEEAARQKAEEEAEIPIETDQVKLVADLVSGTPGVDDTGIGWTTNLISRWIGGAVIETGELIVKTPGAIAGLLETGAKIAWSEFTNRANWEAAGETIMDLTSVARGDWKRVAKAGGNVIEGGVAVGKVVAHLGRAAWETGLTGSVAAVGKAVLNVENWEKAIDPNVPVTERFGRAVWGAIDTGGLLIGAGGAAAKGVSKIDDLIRGADVASDMARGASVAEATRAAGLVEAGSDAARAADLTGDAARTADISGDAARAADITGDTARAADTSSDAARAADLTGDAARSGEKTSEATRAAGRAAREADAAGPRSIEELRDTLRTQKRGALAEAGAGKNVERAGIPDMATDPEGYARGLPSGALVDRNLATGTGYTGYQIDDMARFAKEENVIVGARNTNIDSMRHIRDGKAVPKPLEIKSKTIAELDTYLGARAEDKGLVGYFKPKQPDRAAVPDHLWDKVNGRYQQRLEEYNKLRGDINRLIAEGKVVEREGKLQAVIRNADGTTSLKPYAGDIDGVYFRSGTPPHDFIPPGPEYERLKAAWMGRANQEAGIPQYWGRSGAPGQHGVETNVVADLTRGKTPGTPEFEKALAKARGLHENLEANHFTGKDFIIETDQAGNLRRGMRITPESPLPELSGLS